MAAVFVLNPAALASVLITPGGMVGRDIAKRAQAVESQAKINASGRPGPRVRTGRLRSSIGWVLTVDQDGLVGIVGSNVEYAGFVERGTNRAPPYPYLRPALEAAR